MKQAAHLALHPFAQIPTYEYQGLVLFDSGAIILHVAQRYAGLLPDDVDPRARAIASLFAALNTVEPPIVELEQVQYTEQDKPWHADRLPLLEERVRARLQPLAARLGQDDWLDGGFSVGDLMMVMVLRRLDGTSILEAFPTLAAYVARAVERPAYQRAFAAQRAVFLAGTG